MIIIRCLGSKWSASASIAAIWGALLIVALVCLPHKLRVTMVSGIVGLARDVDAEFVEAWTAAFASAKSEPLGSVAARNIVRGPQPGVAFPFSQSEITSAVKTSAEFILADGFGKNLFMPEYATDSQPYSIVGIMRNILGDDDRGIDSAHSEWAGDPHRSSSFRSSANYRWGGTGVSEAAGTLGTSSGLSSKSGVAAVNPRVDTGNSGGKFKLTRVNQTFDSGRVSYDNRIGKDPSGGKDPSNDNHSAVFERDLTASILADGLRDDRVEARGGYRGSLGRSPHSFDTFRPSADYAWGGAVVSDNGSTRDPVPSSASETVIAAVADPLPVNSSSKFNLAAVTPDDLFTTVTCNSEDPSSSRLPADDVVDSMAIMLLGQSEDGRHSPLTSEGLLGTAADGGGGDRDLRAVDFGKTTPNQFHVEDVGPGDKTAVTSEPTSMVLLGTVLLGISGGARFRILRCRPKLRSSNAQR